MGLTNVSSYPVTRQGFDRRSALEDSGAGSNENGILATHAIERHSGIELEKVQRHPVDRSYVPGGDSLHEWSRLRRP